MSKKIQWKTKLTRETKNREIGFFASQVAKGGLTVLISVLIAFTIVQAGSLTPSASPAATGYTLSDIYTRLTTNATATQGDHSFSPGASPAGTLYTLTQIYEAIPTIAANMVKLGTSYLGVNGTLVPSGGDAATANVCNGNTFFGSSQADWNLQTGSLNPTASTIISGNTYCGVAGTAVATPTFGDNDASKVLTTAGNAGTYDASSLTPSNVRNTIAFGVGQTGIFTGNLAYGDDDAANVLTTASTPGTYNVSNLSNSVIKQSTTWGVSFGSTGTLTPDGGTAAVADLFNSKTAHLTADWNLDSGTLDLACNTATFDGTGNIVADVYDGSGSGANRWCITDSGDAVAGDILSGKIGWVDGVARTGSMANIGAQTITPSTSNQTITAGYHNGSGYCAGDADLTVSNIKKGIDLFSVFGTYSGYPGTGWVANGSGDGSTALTQAACDAAANWYWFEDGNGDGDTTDPEDGICVLSAPTASKSWNGDDDVVTGWRDNTYIASYECEGNFPTGTITAGTYRAIDDVDPAIVYDTTWNNGDCALCQADCYDGKKDLPNNPYNTGSHYIPSEAEAGHNGYLTPEILKNWVGTRLPTSNDFFGFCGATNGDANNTVGDGSYYSSGASADTTIGRYGKNVGRGTANEYMDLSNSNNWEWLSEQHSYISARVAGYDACSNFSYSTVYNNYRFRAVFRP